MSAASLMMISALLAGCQPFSLGHLQGSGSSTSIAIPKDCNQHLKKVAPADVKGDHAKAAWLKSEKKLDKANARIERGAQCWDRVVDGYLSAK
jgi:hypothetical protein